jgi:tRNA(adenine34) deaminase
MTDLEYMDIAYQEALEALKIDEVPVGAVIVKDGKIISQAHNLKEKYQQVSRHAEMIAIEEAEKKLKTWHLDDCTLYTTLEPCIMCSGAIIQSRISKVFVGAKGERWDGLTEIIKFSSLNHYPKIQTGILEKECSLLISQYFQSKRHHL